MASAVRVRIAASTCAVLLAGLVIVAADSPRADSHTILWLIVDAQQAMHPAMRASVIAEAARIWSRYDVSVMSAGEEVCGATSPATVTVTVAVGRDTESGDAGLGAIQFAADGTPEPAIVLNFDAVARIATSAPFMGVHPALWPAGLRDQIIARALGRALAHEIGHYLLRSPHHASSGLMQARQKGVTLGDPSSRPFALTQLDRARLRVALASPLQTVCPVLAAR